MTDQRLAGLSHQELWNLAHGGDPAAASTSQASFSRVAQALGNVSNTLRAPLAEFGLGWQGQAANSARAGIAQHAQWAQAAAARATLAGGQVMRQAASARQVIAEIPPPPASPVGPAGAPGGVPHPVGPDQTGVNWALDEQARVNARQRALELMQRHAEESQRNRPTTRFAPPTSAGVAGAAARAGAAAGRGGSTSAPGKGNPSRTAPLRSPGSGATGPSTGRAGLGTGRAASSSGAPSASTGRAVDGSRATQPTGGVRTRGHESGVPSTRPASATPYPAKVGATPPDAVPRGRTSMPVGPEGAERGDRAALPSGPAVLGSRRGSPDGAPVSRPGRISGESTSGASTADSRSQGRGVVWGAGGQPGGGQPGVGGAAERAEPPGRPGPPLPSPPAMMPPMLGGPALSAAGLGGAVGDEDTEHRRPDYLLEESDLFTDDDEWVAPPVIGS